MSDPLLPLLPNVSGRVIESTKKSLNPFQPNYPIYLFNIIIRL